MIGFLKGKIFDIDVENSQILLLTQSSVGYEVFVPKRYFKKLKKDNEISLYIYFLARENGIYLFGFLSRREKKLFSQILKAKGVGAKIALSLLSVFTPEEFVKAVEEQNINVLTSAEGVGKKLARQIIVDLKNSPDFENLFGEKESDDKAVKALVSLGLSEKEAVKLFRKFEHLKEPDKIIKASLQEFQRRKQKK